MARIISPELQAALDAGVVQFNHQVLIEFGSNKFNDGQAITSSGDKQTFVGFSTLDDPPTRNTQFWRKEDAFNSKNRLGMKWLVCDQGALVVDTADGTGFRAIPLKDGDYERGWWGTGGSGYVQSDWLTPRLINKITLYSMEGYPNIANCTVEYNSGGWTSAFSGSLDSGTYINSWDVSAPDGVLCTGLRVTVGSMVDGDAKVSELQGYYIKDVSDLVITLDITEIREEYESTVPIGTTASNSFSLELDNSGGEFSIFGEDALYGPFLTEGNRVEIYLGANTAEIDLEVEPVYEMVKLGEYFTDDWSISTESMSATTSGRDYSKYLQEDGFQWSKMWRNVYAKEAIQEILMMHGVPFSSQTIETVDLNKFGVIYSKQEPPWSLLGEIALADQAVFGFDEDNNFYYQSYTALGFPAPVLTLNGNTNVISASVVTRLYINKITVKVTPFSETEKLVPMWAAPNPTILSYAQLAGGIGADDTTITIGAAPHQADGNLTNNGWPLRNGYLFIPVFDPIGELIGNHIVPKVIGGELIKYRTRTESTFQDCERGYLYTTAQSHAGGAYVGEARVFNMEFQNAPALTVNYPFVTAIDYLMNDLEEVTRQAHVIFFSYDAMGGQLSIGNIANYYTWLSGTGLTLNDVVLDHRTAKINFGTAVSGKALAPVGKEKVGDTVDNPTASNNDLIRRYGKNEITIDSPWIQTVSHAQTLVDGVIAEYARPRRIIEVNCIGELAAQLGDVIYLEEFDQFGLTETTIYTHVIGIRYNYSGGLSTSFTLREVHQIEI